MKSAITKVFGWKNNLWLFWILTILSFIILGCVCWVLSFTRQDAAAWAQAIGSIAAIYGSVAIVNRQHKLEIVQRRKDDLEQRIQVARQLMHLVSFASWPGVAGPTPYTTDQKYESAKNLPVEHQKRMLRLLEAFPIFEIKDPMPITQIQAAINNWVEGIRLMKKARDLARSNDSGWESAYEALTAFPCQTDQRMERLREYVTYVRDGTYTGYQ